ncbi:DNA phosphorothioation-dependent restriction protein DptH [Lysinibacillus sp. KU-BSD001]|uniref:DNA phosphorothioation-dependent restriction protein DptH n=1 Tax=Lysinibacillus sp. KU-BSD001 TaxID=3141328 RepID=UPI0036EEDF8B
MSNQFYNYIANELIAYWDQTEIQRGNRYFLRLDTLQEVLDMVTALKTVQPDKVSNFTYMHEQGAGYETFSLAFGDIKIVIANTDEVVKTDYLALIRNLVSEQQPGWENTALISIVSEQLDTIPGGSLDMQSEGMPLHPKTLSDQLEKEIHNSMLGKAEKLILEDNLEKLLQDYQFMKLSIFEFEEILTILEKGKIDQDDYKELGMFMDPELPTYSGKNLKNRIQENREMYDFVSQANEFNDTEEQLQKKFNADFAKKMQEEGWEIKPYTEIQKEHKKFIEHNKAVKVTYEKVSADNGLVVWDKPKSDSAAGKRKRNIIVFNPMKEQEVKLVIKFELEGAAKTLRKEFLSNPDKYLGPAEIEVKNSTIHVKITPNDVQPAFVKFNYEHDNKVSLGAEFNICVLPIGSYLFEASSSSYGVDAKKKALVLKATAGRLSFGTNYPITNIDLTMNEAMLSMEELGKTIITIDPSLFDEEDALTFSAKVQESVIPIRIDSELIDSTPIQGARIWKLVRESMLDMTWIKELNRLTHNHREYYMQSSYQEFFEWEYKWLKEGMRFAKLQSGVLVSETLELGEELREAYSRFLSYFITPTMISSLTHVSAEYAQRGRDYLEAYHKEVEAFQNGVPAGKKGVSLYRLGTIEANDIVYMTPFHPLMVAYKLKVYEQLGNEEMDNVILNRLTPEALLPFLEKGELYRPQYQDDAPEWLVFKSVNQVTASDSVQYLSKVITDKIKQFKEHFGYLFTQTSKAPILINVMNLPDDYEVLIGILNFILHEVKTKGAQSVKSIEVTLYKESQVNSAFEKFAQLTTVEEVIDYTKLTQIKKIKDVEADVVLKVLRESLFFYRRTSQEQKWDLRYAHITFYKMHAQESSAMQSMHEMKSDVALSGLYASVPAMRDAETYKSGFGIKNYLIEADDYLIRTAYYVNEVIANSRNEGNDSYVKGNTVLSRVNTTDETTLLEIFDHSHWVTFIDPTVDLEFFKNFNNDIVVIHYSDQYTSSNKFDAITVTNKSDQYYKVIEEFLHNKGIEGTENNIKNTIQAFNTFNGEWLLRIIGTKGYADREKLSIISAIKYVLAYLDHPNIKWIPISLEEILRVAGVFNLSKAEGIFSAKNLGIQGPTSDDLLLIGLETSDEQLYIHFYPVEVKIGVNNNNVIAKAKAQVMQTKKVLLSALVKDYAGTFKEKFYKNFFVQLLIANANKMVQGDIWPEKDYALASEVVEKLVKLDFKITDHLHSHIGEGAIISFRTDCTARSSYLDEQWINVIEFSLEDGFNGIVKAMVDICHWLHEEETDFIKDRFLKNQYDASGAVVARVVPVQKDEDASEEVVEEPEHSSQSIKDSKEVEIEIVTPPSPQLEIIEVGNDLIDEVAATMEELETSELVKEEPNMEVQGNVLPKLEDIRIKIGTAVNSNKEIYWEYGHSELANRHLLISGKSGQGKTYFMQCLLLEKSRQGISSIIIDYTEGFSKTQLEPEFLGGLGERFNERIVYFEKLPINPFTRTVREISGRELKESNTDIAERIKSVFSAVYSTLGIQQLNMLYDRILIGLERYDEKMNLMHLKDLLEEEGSGTAIKTLSQIRPLIDRNPFADGESINWKDLIDKRGDVFVIQLTGYPRDVQLIITEFILWDLWNYSIRNGNKHMPMPVIMDEAQNLDHKEGAPSARVLTEGRKFGWSAWFATQFLKAQMDSSELARLQNASQKIYFAQSDEDVTYIANTLANEVGDKKYWEEQLLGLKKGQCIVQGPILEANGKLSKPKTIVVNITPLPERY